MCRNTSSMHFRCYSITASYLNVKTISHGMTGVVKIFCIFDGQIGTKHNLVAFQAKMSLNLRGINNTVLQALCLACGLIIHV